MLLRQKIAYYLEDFESPIGLAINLTILGSILLSSAIFVTETYSIPDWLKNQLNFLDISISSVFAIEYLIRFWCAESKLKFIFSIFSLIDLLAIIPFIIGFADIRYIRIFRWFRILRVIRFFELQIFIFKIKARDRIILVRIFLTLFSIIFVYSGLIYQIEHSVNPQSFANFFDAIYFSIVTMTTVGFGDVIPLSEGGRLMTLLMILTGVFLIPWQLGDLIKQLVEPKDRINIICFSCGLASHETDAIFCKKCGTKLIV
ncbi:MAG: ion transporter [Xenococcaceae cyanobacterium]